MIERKKVVRRWRRRVAGGVVTLNSTTMLLKTPLIKHGGVGVLAQSTNASEKSGTLVVNDDTAR